MAAPAFLEGIQLRPVQVTKAGLRALGLALGKGSQPLEVLVAEGQAPLPTLRAAWKERQGGRAAPLLLVVLHGENVTICGPSGEDPAPIVGVDRDHAERVCREALDLPDRHTAIRFLTDALPALDPGQTALAGVVNEGFLSTHELARGAPKLPAWDEAGKRARPVLGRRGDKLLEGLGYGIERVDNVTSILRIGGQGQKVAVAVLLRQDEAPELHAERFNGLSPVNYALAVAERENAPYVVISQGAKLRLYPARLGIGVGQRSRTETYVEIHTGLLREEHAAYLWLLFSADALGDGGTLQDLLDESRRFAGWLAERLRERIYGLVVPRLAEGLAVARGQRKPSAQHLADTYTMAMTVLFRLLFIAYAEDKDLLPYKHNGLYQRRSLKEKAVELREFCPDGDFGDESSYWDECDALFRAIEEGAREWGVPAYDGGLFSRDPEVSPVGAMLADLSLPNTVFGPVLRDLLLIEGPEGWGPVDFRSLGVREFGTIYEGLLESELSVAETDLVVDAKGFYRPFDPDTDEGEPLVAVVLPRADRIQGCLASHGHALSPLRPVATRGPRSESGSIPSLAARRSHGRGVPARRALVNPA